jgi:osmotically-inducible protein OsmY
MATRIIEWTEGGDEYLCQELCDRLGGARLDTSDVEILVFDGRVTLAGSVPDPSTRRLVEWISSSVPGVRLIANELSVRTDDDRPVPRSTT